MVYVKFKNVPDDGRRTYFVGASYDDILRDIVNAGITDLTAPEVVSDSFEVIEHAKRVTPDRQPSGTDVLAHGVASIRSGRSKSYYLFTA